MMQNNGTALYLKSGSEVEVRSNADLIVTTHLLPTVYSVAVRPNGSFFLKELKSFDRPKRVYGNVADRANRIFNTFMDRPKSTGVLLSGEPGSGKTLLAREVSIIAAEHGFPTIVINEAFTGEGFNEFMLRIDQPCVIIFDEFEKTYDSDDQEAVLSLFDGVFPQKKLFIATVNDSTKLIGPFVNRPGRLYYSFHYKGVDENFIQEYIEENLKDKTKVSEFVDYVKFTVVEISFDSLVAAIEEANRYGEPPKEVFGILNIESSTNTAIDFEIVDNRGNVYYASPEYSSDYYSPVFKSFEGYRYLNIYHSKDPLDTESLSIHACDAVAMSDDGRTVTYKKKNPFTKVKGVKVIGDEILIKFVRTNRKHFFHAF